MVRNFTLAAALLSLALALPRAEAAEKLSTFQDEEPRTEFGQPAEEDEVEQPSIRDPGPDTADFPDSSYIVKPGVLYFETSLTYESSKTPVTKEYTTATMLRYGVTETFELRLFSPGYTKQHSDTGNASGFGILAAGFKKHLWDENTDTGLPSFGLEVMISAPTAGGNLDNGASETVAFFAFDHTLSDDWSLNWNGSLAWLKGDDGDRFLQGGFLWSLAETWNDDLSTFWHGFTTFPGGSGANVECVTGVGFLRFVGNRVAVDGSYNFGLTNESLHRGLRAGFSVAF